MPISNQDLRKAGLKSPRIKIFEQGELLENSKQHHLNNLKIFIKTLLEQGEDVV